MYLIFVLASYKSRLLFVKYYLPFNMILVRKFAAIIQSLWRSHWRRVLKHRSAAACLLRLWVRIPQRGCMFLSCALSGRDLCDELITCPEESYRLWCVLCFWSINLVNERALAHWRLLCRKNKISISVISVGTVSWIELQFL